MSDAPFAEAVIPAPAATVVLLRPGPAGPEVLLTKRPATMAFGPDLHVFPGGRVDPGDAEPAALRATGLGPVEAARRLGLGLAPDGGMTAHGALAHHAAAVREVAEETGIQLAARDLVALSRWVTPPSMARRFDVRFFAAFVDDGAAVTAASREVVEARWLTPRAALEAASRGLLQLWQPTYVTLQQLDGPTDEAAIRRAFAPGPAPGGPVLERLDDGLVRVDAAWAAGIPGRRASGWLVGRREVVVVDPADPTEETASAIVGAVAAAGARLAGVAITDLAPERHAGVEMLAHGLGLPVVGPTGLTRRAPYPLVERRLFERPPFGDAGWSLARVLRPRR